MRLKLKAPNAETYKYVLSLLKDVKIFVVNEGRLLISTEVFSDDLMSKITDTGTVITEEVQFDLGT